MMAGTRTITDDIRVTYRWGPWTDWAGLSKKCPIPEGILHQVRFRDGSAATDDAPQTWDWKHSKMHPQGDIMAFRIRKGK